MKYIVPYIMLLALHSTQGLALNAKVDCDSTLSDVLNKIDPAFITTWAEQAVLQSYKFNPTTLDTQLQKLHSCYTENGWVSFQSALKRSGNLNVIKTKNVIVSSRLDGTPQLIETKNTHWKISVPIQVTYKNDEKFVIHYLSVYVWVGWRNTSKLGIAQIIAVPRAAALSQKSKSIEEAAQIMYGIMALKSTQGLTALDEYLHLFGSKFTPVTTRTTSPSFEQFSNEISALEDKTLTEIQAPQMPNKVQTIAQIHAVDRQQATIKPQYYQDPLKVLAGEMLHYVEFIKTLKLTQKNEVRKRHTVTINCDYNDAVIEPEHILSWAQYAAVHSFAFNSTSIDSQLEKLQSCYTEQGWAEFNAALQKSGNYEAVKALNLNIFGEVNGAAQLVIAENDQWVVTTPIKLVYQQEHTTITKLLNVSLTIGRKTSGALGIIHIIAKMDEPSTPDLNPTGLTKNPRSTAVPSS